MKKHTMIGAVIAAMFVSAAAYSQTDLDHYNAMAKKAQPNYVMGLRSDNTGLKESALMQTAKVKMLYPEINFQEVERVIDSLVVNGSTPAIRYEAYLSSNVLANPVWFGKQDRQATQDPEIFFVSVASQLQERILGSRTN